MSAIVFWLLFVVAIFLALSGVTLGRGGSAGPPPDEEDERA